MYVPIHIVTNVVIGKAVSNRLGTGVLIETGF